MTKYFVITEYNRSYEE